MLPARRQERDPITSFRREMDRLFDRTLGRFWGDEGEMDFDRSNLVAQYPVDIREDENHVIIDAEVPGFKKDEIDLSYDRGTLRLVAEHREEKKPEGREQRIERRYQRIERAVTLPEEVDASKVEATLEDGVLHVKLPKAEPSRQPNRIEIR